MSKLVVIRTDSSQWLGLGHLMRCISIAKALQAVGYRPVFLCRDHLGQMSQLVSEHGLELKLLPGSHLCPDNLQNYENWLGYDLTEEIREVQQTMQDLGKASILLVDHYSLDSQWESALASYCERLLVIDDLANRPHQCDLLLDQTLGRNKNDYHGLLQKPCQLLLGVDFAPIRSQFVRLAGSALERHQQTSQVKQILISLGGVDADNLSLRLLQLLSQLDTEISIDLLLGGNAPHQETIKDWIEANELMVNLHIGNTLIAPLMAAADLAIGAAGTSAWERSCMSLPSLLIILAENQKPGGMRLAQTGAVELLGLDELEQAERFLSKVRELMTNHQKRQQMSLAGAKLVNGYGLGNLVAAIDNYQSRSGLRIGLRPATMQDAEQVLGWQQHPNTRKHARNPKIPSAAEHFPWFARKLADPGCIFSIITEADKAVGVLRLDQLDAEKQYEVSILIDPERYQQGLAKCGLMLLNSLLPDLCIHATVLEANDASHALFRSVGYHWTGEHYQRDPM